MPVSRFLHNERVSQVPASRFLHNERVPQVPASRFLHNERVPQVPVSRFLHNERVPQVPVSRFRHNERVPQVPRFWAPGMRMLPTTSHPDCGPSEDAIPNRKCTVNNNTNKSHSFNALSQYPVQFQRILQKCVQFSATLCLQMFNSWQPIRSHALSTKLRRRRNANL